MTTSSVGVPNKGAYLDNESPKGMFPRDFATSIAYAARSRRDLRSGPAHYLIPKGEVGRKTRHEREGSTSSEEPKGDRGEGVNGE